MTLLASTLEAGSSGSTIVAGTSGGGPNADSAFDAVNIGTGATVAYDNTHAAHGSLAAKIATGGTAALAALVWNTSMGTQSQVWFRGYYYFTANPGASIRLWNCTATSTSCGSVNLSTAGKLSFTVGSAGTTAIAAFTAAIPLNQWFRIEGWLTGNASTGQVSLSLFSASADEASPDETHTSAATFNTTGSPTTYSFGSSNSIANVGPYWIDDVALSSTAVIGPALVATTLSDGGTGTDASAVTASVALAESGAGAETLAVTASVALSTTGTGTDAAAVTAAVTLAESGAAADVPGVSVPVALADAGTGTDAAAVTAALALTDAGSGSDGSPVTLAAVSLAELGAAADVLAQSLAVLPFTVGTLTAGQSSSVLTAAQSASALTAAMAATAALTASASSAGGPQ